MTIVAAPKALSQAEIFRAVNYRPHAGQVPVFLDDHRFQVLACGRRFGKSDVGGHKLLPEAFLAHYMRSQLEDSGDRMEYWIVGPEYTDAEKEFRVIYNELKKLGVPFDRPGTYNDPIQGNMHISLWGGKYQVHGKSAKHPETLVGEGLHGVIVAEAAKVKERVWTKFVRPTLNDYRGWALLSSTPEGKNWFYDAYMRGQNDAQRAWASWRRPAWMNPHVYRDGATDAQVAAVRQLMDAGIEVSEDMIRRLMIDAEVVQLMNDLTEPMFNQEIAALFTEYVGRVFQDFDEETHVTNLAFNPEWRTYAAVDYGFTNPNVWLLIQEDPFGEYINILGEVYGSGMAPDEFAEEVVRQGMAPPGLITFFPDPASPGDTKIMEEKLRVRHTGGTGGELKFRVDAIRKALKPPRPNAERPRMMVDSSCRNFIREFNDYRYPETKSEAKNEVELPMKKDDHTPEALGRYFAGRKFTTSKQARRARQTTASMGR